ncbi:hypothetical protein RI820_000921 [Pluralibacter gergoviae]|nr:hypothetical protein [Pluralibacter gergoviae]ELC3016064.1 hypothetical protein [Pluralibacter gergoviae]ELC3021044.1 hypothetical protein [Pluralibacter gergoviae]
MNKQVQTTVKFREELISQLENKDDQLNVEEVRKLISLAISKHLRLFDNYIEDAVSIPLSLNKSDWHSPKYYKDQWYSLKENFSEKRVYHMLEVYSYSSKLGISGFSDISNSNSVKEASSMKHSVDLSYYVPEATLARVASEKNIELVRSSLINELSNSRYDDEEVTKALCWVTSKVPNLFAAYEETTLAKGLNADSSQWTSDYYHRHASYIDFNFSLERFEHLIAVRNELRRQGVKGFQRIIVEKPQSRQNSSAGQSASPKPSSSRTNAPESEQKKMPLPLIIGGALAALAAIIFSLIKG